MNRMAQKSAIVTGAGPTPPVTIVIPIYDDLPTLTTCIESVKRNVDLERNRVLLVNDCGPDADFIEASLLAQIQGYGSIRCERNSRNLGFVGTCNRAVTELGPTTTSCCSTAMWRRLADFWRNCRPCLIYPHSTASCAVILAATALF